MKPTDLNERIAKIRNYIKKAQFQRALNHLDEFSKLIGDKELDREVLMLNARFSSEFKEYLNGIKSSKEDLNLILLSITYVLNEAIELAEDKFKEETKIETNQDFIEKITLESNNFHKSIKGLSLNEEDKNNLLNAISIMSEEISKSQGKRILWIDDKPHKIIGERRFFRSLGLEIVTGNNRDVILKLLEQDGDFDIIISDIQWLTSYEGVTYGRLNMIKELRKIYLDSFIGKLKVIFYTGYRKEQITIIDKQTGIKDIENSSIMFSIDRLIMEVFSTLTENKNSVILEGRKIPT